MRQDKVPNKVSSLWYHAPYSPGTMGGTCCDDAQSQTTELPKQIFYGELWDGKRTVGGQKKKV